MKVLCVVPLPPPATGLSIISKNVIKIIRKEYNTTIVNLSKNNFVQGNFGLGRFFGIIVALYKILCFRMKTDIVYLTVAQSMLGNIRDLCIIWLCRKKKIILHLHGGGIRQTVFERNRILFLLNKTLHKYICCSIVLSESLKKQYWFLPDNKITVVNNYVEKGCFLDKSEIKAKVLNSKKLNIAYLSNMIKEKGYTILADSVLKLDKENKKSIEVIFIGAFDSKKSEDEFLLKIKSSKKINYIGPVYGSKRFNYLKSAHIFCLPTFHPFGEGQPLSILEAYAAGCVVITTPLGGIPDIFKDGVNGFYTKMNSVLDLKTTIEKIADLDKKELLKIALHNAEFARKKFARDRFEKDIKACFKKVIQE